MTRPNTVFWFIPHGHTTQATPLETVSDVACGDGRQSGAFGGLATTLVIVPVIALIPLFMLLEPAY